MPAEECPSSGDVTTRALDALARMGLALASASHAGHPASEPGCSLTTPTRIQLTFASNLTSVRGDSQPIATAAAVVRSAAAVAAVVVEAAAAAAPRPALRLRAPPWF